MDHQARNEPEQSLDLNINDPEIFASLTSRVWRERDRTSDALVAEVQSMYGQYDVDSLELV